jgi:hypothetical protein
MEKLKLRPHHALCIQFFIGKGYSAEFTENMYNIIEKLKFNPDITVTMGADVLCSKCPNLQDGICINESHVKYTDKKTAEICGFKDGMIVDAEDFFGRADDKIINAKKMCEVCQQCRWNSICYSADKFIG